jgi:carbohydrate-binding DOMON domain-containing protein
VQPGTTTSLLKSTGGIPLSPTAVTTVGLNGVSQGSSSQTVQPAPITHHHVDATFLAIPGLLIVAALVAFWITGRSVKNTTDY